MSRIAARFADLRAAGRKALIPYITAGDPQPDITVPLLHTLVEAGADLLEIGVPFSDPMADGPAIQAACERALKHNTSLTDVLQMVREFRTKDTTTPIILMGYLNPIEVMGYATFAAAAQAAGVDGVLTVDMPPEEAGDLAPIFAQHALDPIFLLAPTSTDERIQKICALARGFVYYVSIKGITGAKSLDVDAVAEKLASVKPHTDLPIGVGFGISDGATAARVATVADAVIVGSAIVNRIADNAHQADKIQTVVGDFVRELRTAMDA